jgi:hypothetical protein
MSDADGGELGRVERALDRIDERLAEAPPGMHRCGRPAASASLQTAGLPATAALVWARFDGMELACGEARLFALVELATATRTADAEGILAPGDRVIGERGRTSMVLPADPWSEGAEVVSIDEEGERAPEASSVAHLVLGWLGEISVLYDDDGDFREDLFDEDSGELTLEAQRRLLRRRLDFDPDAPRARLELARSLAARGEHRGAQAELKAVLKRAPEYAWAHHELGHVHSALGQERAAHEAHARAAQSAREPEVQALFWAWAALRSSSEEQRARCAREVLERRAAFVAHQLAGAKSLLELGRVGEAQEMIELGLAVAPRSLELLALRRVLPPSVA